MTGLKTNTLTLDIDGVIAGGHYIPAWDREPKTYLKLPIKDKYTWETLNRLSNEYHVYLVSGRRFPNALTTTQNWLLSVGLDPGIFAGVIVGIPRLLKASMAEQLGAALHFDDDPRVVSMMGVRGVRFKSDEWPGHEHLEAGFPVVHDWKELGEFVDKYFSAPVQLTLPFAA